MPKRTPGSRPSRPNASTARGLTPPPLKIAGTASARSGNSGPSNESAVTKGTGAGRYVEMKKASFKVNQAEPEAAASRVRSESATILPTNANPRLAMAFQYTQRGWPVFPVIATTKRPMTDHGFHDATTDPATILRWWEDHPDANVGIQTGAKSRLLVLDVDLYKFPNALADLERREGKLPKTYTVETPRGGKHFYFRLPANSAARCTAEVEGVCVKANGGYGDSKLYGVGRGAKPSGVQSAMGPSSTRFGKATRPPSFLRGPSLSFA